MSDYPEHDKLRAAQAETQAAGEFVEWLNSQGIQLMTYREDLTDTRTVDDECKIRKSKHNPRSCDNTEDDGDHSVMYWMRHCLHWQDPDRAVTGDAVQGECCYCDLGRFREVHGLRAWTSPGKNLQALLADWADIDQSKIEAEKRQMLAVIRQES